MRWQTVDRKSNGEINVLCKTDRGPIRGVGIETNNGSDGKGEWSEMVGACVGEGLWACFKKSVGV